MITGTWKGANICLAKLETKKDLIFFNSIPDNIANIDQDTTIILECINELFSRPVYADDVASYSPSQFLAELIKKNKYDGIIYKSSLCEEGDNIAIFRQFTVDIIDLFDIKITKTDIEYTESISKTEIMDFCLDHLDDSKPIEK